MTSEVFKLTYESVTGRNLIHSELVKLGTNLTPGLVCTTKDNKVTYIVDGDTSRVNHIYDEVIDNLINKKYIKAYGVYINKDTRQTCKICDNPVVHHPYCPSCHNRNVNGLPNGSCCLMLGGKKRFNTSNVSTKYHFYNGVYTVYIDVNGIRLLRYTGSKGQSLEVVIWKAYVAICLMYDYDI